jgi:pilus assembly protein CpaC
MIVITPYLVKPVNANDIVLPTDGYKAPTDLNRVLFGQLSDGKTGTDRPKPSVAPPVGAQPTFGAVTPAQKAPAPLQPRREEVSALPAAPAASKKNPSAAPGFSIN